MRWGGRVLWRVVRQDGRVVRWGSREVRWGGRVL